MPAISVLLEGKTLATVNTEGYDVLSVHVHGTRIDDDLATLEMSGGSYPESGESTHLTWINSQPLLPGQLVEVRFLEGGETFPPGKTIEQLFPDAEDESPEEPADFKPTPAMFAELRSKTPLRDGFGLQLRSSSGSEFAGRTSSGDHGFGFTLVWNSHRPFRASHSLHAYTLDELEARSGMRDYIREYIHSPSSVTLRVDA